MVISDALEAVVEIEGVAPSSRNGGAQEDDKVRLGMAAQSGTVRAGSSLFRAWARDIRSTLHVD
jgi:hypothetical protein